MATKPNPNSCLICGRQDKAKPMCFKGEPWCSDRHRKVFSAQVVPTSAEWIAMDAEIYDRLWQHWSRIGVEVPLLRNTPENP